MNEVKNEFLLCTFQTRQIIGHINANLSQVLQNNRVDLIHFCDFE
jgi:hypothetical protein